MTPKMRDEFMEVFEENKPASGTLGAKRLALKVMRERRITKIDNLLTSREGRADYYVSLHGGAPSVWLGATLAETLTLLMAELALVRDAMCTDPDDASFL